MARLVRRARPAETGGRPTAVGAFIFAGGFTLGVREHFDVLCHLEDGPFGAAQSRDNLGLEVHEDPGCWPTDRLARRGVDLVYCNPPCAPFSSCNVGGAAGGWKSDPRVECISKCFTLLGSLSPKVWCFESVRGAFRRGREMCDEMVAEAADLGYGAYHVMTEARLHGVPQVRRRYFMFLSKYDIDWTPTRIDPPGAGRTIDRETRATGPGPHKRPRDRDKLLAKVRPGEHLRDVWDRLNPEGRLGGERNAKGGRVGRPAGIEYRVHPDKQTPGAVGSMPMYHHREPRLLGVNEVKALCGFPQGYRLPASPAAAYNLMLKGVMPPVAEYVAARAAESIRRAEPIAPGTNVVVTIGKDGVRVEEASQ